MAVLSNTQLAEMRRSLRSEWTDPIDFTKPLINGVFQAIEDEYERAASVSGPGFKLSASSGIDGASQPAKTFTNPQKKKIGRAYLGEKFNLETS